MSTWTREHDALIARVAECYDILWVGGTEPHMLTKDRINLGPAPHYLTDLTAIARAQEAWFQQDVLLRMFRVERFEEFIGHKTLFVCAMIGVNPSEVSATGDTESAARAWATWLACGGVE